MLEKEFVPYQEALALKELGFDEPCFGRYWHEDFKLINIDKQFEKPDYVCLSPLYQQAFRWFREKYNIIPNLQSIYEDETRSKIMFFYWFGNYDDDDSNDEVNYGTYEEMQLECLKKLIEIVRLAKP